MTNGDPPPSPPRPPPVRPTAAWLAEQRAKRLAYEDQRRRHAQAWHRGSEPEEEPDPSGQTLGGGRGRRPSRGRIHDARQGKLDV
ncbi:MAG: hypothetical protein M3Y41_06275 [Pseudomonadota bacterium]|nr:hypothetical protein [Pseudomonadota bacterium]